MAKCRDGVALDLRRYDGGCQRLPSIESLTSSCPFSELRLQLISPSTSPNELNTTLMPHSIIPGDACLAYFNKIWGILHFFRILGQIFDRIRWPACVADIALALVAAAALVPHLKPHP